MTGFVKGFVKPELNATQQRLLDMFIEEQNENGAEFEPARIDRVDGQDARSILIYTSRFIQIEHPQRSSMQQVRHLQLMTIHQMWDEGEDDFDPYGDYVGNVEYREVYLTNVFRTFEGDEGWATGSYQEGGKTHFVYEMDRSSLHLWA